MVRKLLILCLGFGVAMGLVACQDKKDDRSQAQATSSDAQSSNGAASNGGGDTSGTDASDSANQADSGEVIIESMTITTTEPEDAAAQAGAAGSESASQTISGAASDAADGISDAASQAAGAVSDAASQAGDAISNTMGGGSNNASGSNQ